MAQIIKPPSALPDTVGQTVFLAGSIDMGNAEDWQSRFENALEDLPDVCVLNPRRDDWDSSWEQSIDNPQFRGQVEWELNGMAQSDVIAMYFAPGSKAPISLLELGLHARDGKLIVLCPKGYWRKGNVDIICEHYGILQVGDFDALVSIVRRRLGYRWD